MSIIFRPNRSTLVDAMAEAMEFVNEEQMKSYIVKGFGGFISIEDIIIANDQFDDERIGWKDSKYVLTKRMGNEDYMKLYGVPQSIGTCATIYPKKEDESIVQGTQLPKYSLGESLSIRSMGIQYNDVVVTRRIVEYDFDKGLSSCKFLYDLKHNIKITNVESFTISRLTEKDIAELVRDYNKHEKEIECIR